MVEVAYVESIGRTTLHGAERRVAHDPMRDVLEALKDLRPDMGQQAWMNLAREMRDARRTRPSHFHLGTAVSRAAASGRWRQLQTATRRQRRQRWGITCLESTCPTSSSAAGSHLQANSPERSAALVGPKRQRERFLQQKRQTQIALNAVEAGTTHPRYVPSHARTETARGGAQAGAEHAGAGGSWGQGRSDAEMYGERATRLRLGPAGALGSGIGGDDGGGASAGSAIEVYKELDLNEQILCGKFDDEGS